MFSQSYCSWTVVSPRFMIGGHREAWVFTPSGQKGETGKVLEHGMLPKDIPPMTYFLQLSPPV